MQYIRKENSVLFVDFSKAYDRVPRGKLVESLKHSGCGKMMIKAIKAMYTCTKNVLKSAVIDSSIGVRQGAPTSCLLFTLCYEQISRMSRVIC